MSKVTAKGILEVLKKSGQGFLKDKVPKLSGSLAYYTIFSIGPMLIVMIFLANLFWGENAIEGNIVGQLKGLIGNSAALQIQEIIKNASIDSNGTFATIAGFVTLVIGATTVFSEIQDSINSIWNLKLKESTGWFKLLLTRILSFSIVVALGFLLLVSLIINGLLEGLMNHLEQMFPDIAVIVIYIVNLLLTLVVTAFLFAIIFKVLPDAHIKWRDVTTGAIFTAILFMIAKFGITLYVGKSDIGSTYGAAGSLVVVLTWIYFSAMILYFGAEFTKAYALKYGGEIRPNKYTETVQTVEVKSKKSSVQENERSAAETQKKAQEQNDKENKDEDSTSI
jgi:membrane protein